MINLLSVAYAEYSHGIQLNQPTLDFGQ